MFLLSTLGRSRLPAHRLRSAASCLTADLKHESSDKAGLDVHPL